MFKIGTIKFLSFQVYFNFIYEYTAAYLIKINIKINGFLLMYLVLNVAIFGTLVALLQVSKSLEIYLLLTT